VEYNLVEEINNLSIIYAMDHGTFEPIFLREKFVLNSQ